MAPDLSARSDDPETARSASRPPLPLSRRLYEVVRERIIRGHYPQGTRLPEARIGQEFQVSRVPMREAIPLLERDGFVETSPRRGAIVLQWTEQAVLDLLDVRSWLEPAAACRAARAVGAGASSARIDAAVARADVVRPGGDRYAATLANIAFHEAVVALTGNDLLSRVAETIAGRITWLFYLTERLDDEWVSGDHRRLRDAIVAGDEQAAGTIAVLHVERDREPSLAAVRSIE